TMYLEPMSDTSVADEYEFRITIKLNETTLTTTQIEDFGVDISLKRVSANKLPQIGSDGIPTSGTEDITSCKYQFVSKTDLTMKVSAVDKTTITTATILPFLYDAESDSVYKTTEVKEEAFGASLSGAYTLNKITLPNTIIRFKEDAFSRTQLTEVFIPASVTDLGSNAFSSAKSLKKVEFSEDINIKSTGSYTFNSAPIQEIELPESLTSIGYCSFQSCAFTELVIPKNVKTIESWAFNMCESLVFVDLPEGLETIGDMGLAQSKKLVELYIPGSVTKILGGFNYSDGLSKVITPDVNKWAQIAFKDKYSNPLGEGALLYERKNGVDTLVEDLVIDETVTKINDYAFYNCFQFKSISISKTVQTISDNAFLKRSGLFYPSKLESINVDSDNQYFSSNGNCLVRKSDKALILGCKNTQIPNNNTITKIGNYAFLNCEDLKSITLPDSLLTIGDYAFYRCSLTSLVVPDGVTSIGSEAFNYNNISSLKLSSSLQTISGSAFYNCPLTTLTIPSTVTSISSTAFHNSNSTLQSIVVEEGNTIYYSKNNCLIQIEGKKLIMGCNNSQIPTDEGILTIESNAFYNCTKLKNVVLPETLTTINSNAFYNCFSIRQLTIPASVTTISSSAFTNTNLAIVTNKTEKTFTTNAVAVVSSEDYIYKDENDFYFKKVIDATTSAISYILIDYRGEETEITLPSQITVDEISYTITEIASKAFYNIHVTSITIPDTIKTIGTYAFAGSNIQTITIPSSVTNIYSYAFSDCNKLVRIINDSSKTISLSGYPYYKISQTKSGEEFKNIITEDGVVLYKYYFYEYLQCVGYIGSKVDVVVPSLYMYNGVEYPVTHISDSAFYKCNLNSLTLPNTITTLEYGAFDNANIKNLELPASLTSIGNEVFLGANFENLTVAEGNTKYVVKTNCLIDTSTKTIIYGWGQFIIPDDGSVENIANYAFAKNTPLKKVVFPSSLKTIGENIFYYYEGWLDATFYNDNLISIGYDAFHYTKFSKLTISDIGKWGGISFANQSACPFYTTYSLFVPIPALYDTTGDLITKVVVDESVTKISKYAFYYCKVIESVVLPEGLIEIGNNAFQYCTNLTNINIPSSVTKIGANAFGGCNNFRRVLVENTVGWFYASSSTATTGTDIEQAIMQKPKIIAAKYLSSYYSYALIRTTA
ncbi:MAG: leucine-rich repeat domain-containing protein, partial [Clostridia bacterium]|nr:leucine-rich repeat domain-containing protein [Clostridia bacterium]